MKNLKKDTYFESIKDGLALVIVGADWCKDCKRIGPIVDALEKDYKDKINFFDVNFSEEEELKDTLNIRRIPTLIFYKNGQEVGNRLVEPDSRIDIESGLKVLL